MPIAKTTHTAKEFKRIQDEFETAINTAQPTPEEKFIADLSAITNALRDLLLELTTE